MTNGAGMIMEDMRGSRVMFLYGPTHFNIKFRPRKHHRAHDNQNTLGCWARFFLARLEYDQFGRLPFICIEPLEIPYHISYFTLFFLFNHQEKECCRDRD
jgi:hypothetical protein